MKKQCSSRRNVHGLMMSSFRKKNEKKNPTCSQLPAPDTLYIRPFAVNTAVAIISEVAVKALNRANAALLHHSFTAPALNTSCTVQRGKTTTKKDGDDDVSAATDVPQTS